MLTTQLMDLSTTFTNRHYIKYKSMVPLSLHDAINPLHLPSPQAYNASLKGGIGTYLDDDPSRLTDCFPVIFDTGASLAITPSRDDFQGPITLVLGLKLGGMANGMIIEGKGIVEWSFISGVNTIVVKTECYLIPDSSVQLISPQRLFKPAQNITGEFVTREENCQLRFDGLPSLSIPYDICNFLPTAVAQNAATAPKDPISNLCITNENNQNLSPAAKQLLRWHFRFGHRNIHYVQRILHTPPFATNKYIAARRVPFENCPKCEVCQYAKAKRTKLRGKTQLIDKKREGALKDDHLHPGAGVSVDHFESHIHGRTLLSYGRSNSDQYVGGFIFVDQMSAFIYIKHQLGFSGLETIRAKQNYEKLCLDYEIIVDTYLADNGVFKANKFVQHI